MKKRLMAGILVVCLYVGCVLPTSASNDTVVNIPDEWLEQQLLSNGINSNGDNVLTKGELENLTELSLNYGTYGSEDCIEVDLAGLEYAINLEEISFNKCMPKKIEALKCFEKLNFLSITNTNLTDASGVSELNNLETLYLYSNQLVNVPKLDSLTKLETIVFRDNRITEIPSLNNLKNLQDVFFDNNQISSVPSFKELENLRYVNLTNNQITDISNLKDCICGALYLDDNPISDISPMAQIENNVSGWIYLSSSQIVSWERLFELCVEETDISSLIVGNTLYAVPNSIYDFYWKIFLDRDTMNLNEISFEVENEEIAQIEGREIYGNSVGKTECTATFDGIQKKFEIEVVEREKSVENLLEGGVSINKLLGNASSYLDDKQVLWGINTNKAEEITANVKHYISELVYGKNKTTWGNYLVLDNENTLWKYTKDSFEKEYQSKKLFENVKTFDEEYVLLEDGTLHDLNEVKKLTENVKKYYQGYELYALTQDRKFINARNGNMVAAEVEDAAVEYRGIVLLTGNIMSIGSIEADEFILKGSIVDVEQIVNSNCFVKTDGSTWRWSYEWTAEGQIISSRKVDDSIPIYVDSDYLIDSNHILWKYNYNTRCYDKIMEDVLSVKGSWYNTCITKLDGTVWKRDEETGNYLLLENVIENTGNYSLKADGTLWERDNYIIDNVVAFGAYEDGAYGGNVYIVRTDGSVWMCSPYEGNGVPVLIKKGKLTKGDISGDENVSIKDVLMIFSYISGRSEFTDAQIKVGDINGDGKVTMNDLLKVFAYVSGKTDQL